MHSLECVELFFFVIAKNECARNYKSGFTDPAYFRDTCHHSSFIWSARFNLTNMHKNEKYWWLLYLAVLKISQFGEELIWRYYWKKVGGLDIFSFGDD